MNWREEEEEEGLSSQVPSHRIYIEKLIRQKWIFTNHHLQMDLKRDLLLKRYTALNSQGLVILESDGLIT